MANLYRTEEIKKIFEKKVEESGACLINDRSISEEDLLRHIREVRIFQKYANEIIEEMEEADRKYDAEMAEWRAKVETKEAAGDK